jgi:hypothetical protein
MATAAAACELVLVSMIGCCDINNCGNPRKMGGAETVNRKDSSRCGRLLTVAVLSWSHGITAVSTGQEIDEVTRDENRALGLLTFFHISVR